MTDETVPLVFEGVPRRDWAIDQLPAICELPIELYGENNLGLQWGGNGYGYILTASIASDGITHVCRIDENARTVSINMSTNAFLKQMFEFLGAK